MTKQCPQCGASLRDEDPAGLCPACLFGGAVETLLTTGAADGTNPGDPVRPVEGDIFGTYQLLRPIGEGGMGVVYLAEQVRPLRRQVALKVVKLGMDSRQVLARFEGERQSLALMDHPNIARVFDAGTSEAGRPYFVMEYVDGVPITEYCDRHRLRTRERLELFIPICKALQHAHQKGVIHRDVKPSNILVGTLDGKPVPKVIDFGIAKAVDQRAVEGAAFTQLGQFVGTPEYMSPEQADLTSHDVDTATDVYSLGVVLYELLAGALPFDSKALRGAGLAELLRIIREEEPPPLPAKLTGLGGTGTEIAHCRRTDIRSLRRDLTGDLNWIVMKSIDKDRTRRYASASELAADIRRHLDCEAVLASPPSRLYIARKFLRRHRAGVAAAACVGGALIVGVAGIAWEAQVARRERASAIAQSQRAEIQSGLAVAERARAEAKAAEAEEQRRAAKGLFDNVRGLAGSMLFQMDDQIANLQGGTPARETLVKEATAYLDRLAQDARGGPELRRELAAAYQRVGDLQGAPERPNLHDRSGAHSSYTKALELLGPPAQGSAMDPGTARVLIMAHLYRADQQDSRDASLEDLETALRMAETFARQQPKSPEARRLLACALLWSSEPRESANEKNLRRAFSIQEGVLAENPQSPDDRSALSKIERELGLTLGVTNAWTMGKDPVQAADWFAKSLAILDGLIREYPANAQYRRDQADTMAEGAFAGFLRSVQDNSITAMRRAVQLQEDLSSGDPRNIGYRVQLADMESRLSHMLSLAGRRDEASSIAAQSLAVIEKLASEQPNDLELRGDIADYHIKRAVSWLYLSNPPQSLASARTALAKNQELARDQPARLRWRREIASSQEWIGFLIFQAGADRATGLEAYRLALAERQRICDSGRGDSEDLALLAKYHWEWAGALATTGHRTASEAQYRQAIAVMDRVTSTKRGRERFATWAGEIYSDTANFLSKDGKWSEAATYAQKALPLAEADYAAEVNDKSAEALIELIDNLGHALFHLGDATKAAALFRRHIAILEAYAAQSPESAARAEQYAGSFQTMAQFQRQSGDRAGALANYHRALSLLDGLPLETLPASRAVDFFEWTTTRITVANRYRGIAIVLMELEDYPAAVAAARKAATILETLLRNDPQNGNSRARIRETYPVLARALQLSGDLPGTRDALLAWFNPPAPGNTPERQNLGGNCRYALARTYSAMGDVAQGEAELRQTLEWFRRAETAAKNTWASRQEDISILNDLIRAQQGMADVLERLGQRNEALDYRRKAVDTALTVAARAEEDGGSSEQAVQSARANLARLDWNGGVPNLEVARGYRLLGALRLEQLDLVPAHDALTRALEMYTALLGETPHKPEYRLEMALTLQALGALDRRNNVPAAARGKSERARDLALALAREHALPDRNFSLAGLLSVDIAAAEEMVGNQVQTVGLAPAK